MANIHKSLRKVYGDDVVDLSTVRSVGCRLFGQSGYANIQNFPCSCRQHIVLTPDNVQRINNLILADKRVTAKELSLQVGVEEASVCRILKQFEFKKVYAGGSEDVDRCLQRNLDKCAANLWNSTRMLEITFLQE